MNKMDALTAQLMVKGGCACGFCPEHSEDGKRLLESIKKEHGDANKELQALLQKARDLIEFSPIFGTEATNLVCDIDKALEHVPVTGRWRPSTSLHHGGVTIHELNWESYK